jgi:hypothetical protein
MTSQAKHVLMAYKLIRRKMLAAEIEKSETAKELDQIIMEIFKQEIGDDNTEKKDQAGQG